jgi:outer membrane protein assembly factor BamB
MLRTPPIRLAPACLSAVLVALALAGCGGGSSDEPGGGGKLIDWPTFGRVPERTYYLPGEGRTLNPPLHEAWSIDTHALIEFPPALAHRVAYTVNKYGDVRAIRLSDHKVLWRRIGDRRLTGPPKDVTAPVYHRGLVFFAELGGDLIALDAASGRRVWERDLHAHLESSPLAIGDTLYLGDDDGDLLALRVSDGRVRWRLATPDAIKASPSHHDGRIFVADYEGAMFCADATSGKLLWRTNTTRVRPFGLGGFYSSPAVAFGDVYAARDDGTVYAFDQRTGKVDWFFQAHNFIYGSPAVARVPGTPPTVYIGAENGRLYALNARTGKPEWHFDVGGPVPGTATVIGHTVYTSSFKTREAIGIDVRTHRRTFELRQAGYTPVVSDGRRLFLIGYFEVIGLQPTRR